MSSPTGPLPQRELVRLRHALHRDPEVGLHLPRTRDRVLDALGDRGMEVSTGKELTSVTAVVRGSRPGPVVLLRADMDALPVTELPGDDPTAPVSGTEGAAHVCGHDLHTAMLVGAAHLLRGADFPGAVILMFQPGEEGHGGAELMVREGVLEAAGEPPIAAYALHTVASMLPRGLFVSRPGTVLGACDTLEVTMRGAGGHSAMPHTARSPVPALCSLVGTLQTSVNSLIDPFDPVAVTVTGLRAGEADNAVPTEARATLSVRSWATATRDRLREALPRLAEGVARTHGVTAETTVERGYPVTTNDPGETSFAGRVVEEVFGPGRWFVTPRPMPASEDFAFVLDRVPGSYIALGACPAGTDPSTAAPNH
ncbi:M20 metallopeptidase family protein, partial [Streptomyces calidiresistens]